MALIPLVGKARCVKMFDMSPPPDPPIHWDSHRANLNITLVLALIIAVFGLVTTTPLLFIAGLGVAAYSWLTTARQYYIYRDALIIVYGRPRVRVIPFARVSHIELLSLPVGDRLRVQMVGGRPVFLAVRDSDTFRERLDSALEEFRGAQPDEDMGNGSYEARPPY